MAVDDVGVPGSPIHEHVALFAGFSSAGRPGHEQVPAKRVSEGVYEVLGTPALVYGCAAGDVLEVRPDGAFRVLRRGGNIAIHAFSSSAFTDDDLRRLVEALRPLGGLVETPAHRRFLVVTVTAVAGFPAIEAAMERWCAATPDAQWEFGNVYDEDGTPLGWWEDT